MQQPEPWERQPKESSPAWEARKRYIHMGPGRSIERVGEECRKSVGLLYRWSSDWKWVLSAKAFDAYNDSIAQKAASKRLIAEDQARAERWANRVHERPECAYNVFLDSHNDIGTYSKDVKAGKRRLIPKDKAALQTAFVRLDIRAEAAVDKVMAQRATANQPTGSGDDPDVIGNEMALAVLRTIAEMQAKSRERKG